jgi:hypothetical protein
MMMVAFGVLSFRKCAGQFDENPMYGDNQDEEKHHLTA